MIKDNVQHYGNLQKGAWKISYTMHETAKHDKYSNAETDAFVLARMQSDVPGTKTWPDSHHGFTARENRVNRTRLDTPVQKQCPKIECTWPGFRHG
jgi:hypothetical protein